MTPDSTQGAAPRSAFTPHLGSEEAAQALIDHLGPEPPAVVVFFCSWQHDGAALSARLRTAWPSADIIGCSTAGAFTESEESADGVSAFALGTHQVRRSAAALASYGDAPPEDAIAAAMAEIATTLDLDLRTATPDRYVGVVLMDGLGGGEEAVNHALGMAAPTVPFLGGSAGDGLRFVETCVYYNGEQSGTGAVLLLLDMAAPFTVLKTESVEPIGRALTVSEVDTQSRIVRAFGGRPADVAYAEATGLSAESLDLQDFMRYPLSFMEGDRPWLRSPMQRQADGGIRFLSQLGVGGTYQVMRQTDIIEDTRRDLDSAKRALGTPVRGALVFNCVYRRMEMDAEGLHEQHRALYAGMAAAGFHTYGESYLGHVNQTAVMLLVG